MRRPPRSVVRLIVLCCGGALIAASGQQQAPFRGGVDLVSLNVTVAEGSRFVTDLEQHEIEIFEDGIKQDTTFFTKVQQPIALAILLDTSASMEGKIETAQE